MGRSAPSWFPRLGNIPGLADYGDPRIARGRLAGHDQTATVRRFRPVDGEELVNLAWGSEDSRSPASRHSEGLAEEPSTEAMVRRLREALELPGEPSDYHFALLNAYGEMWKRRRDEPDVMAACEELWLLDVALCEAAPDAITDPYSNEPSYYRVPAFGHLVDLYLGEGLLEDASALALRAQRFGQVVPADLEDRVAALRAEDAEVPGGP